MPTMMIRYRVKPDRAAENERYIRGVFDQLAWEKPAGLQYASFKLDDGVSFVHLVTRDNTSDPNPLSQLSAFKEFTATVRDRCDEPPTTVTLTEVGSYGFLLAAGAK